MQSLPKTRLGDMLVGAGLLSAEQLEWALERQRSSYKRLGEILLEAELVSDDDIAEARALQLDMPHVQLGDYPIPNALIRLVPYRLARTYARAVAHPTTKIAVAMLNGCRSDRCRAAPARSAEPSLPARGIQMALDQVYGTPRGRLPRPSRRPWDVEIQRFDSTLQRHRGRAQAKCRPRRQDRKPRPPGGYQAARERISLRARAITWKSVTASTAPCALRNLPSQIQAAITSRIKIMAEMDIAEKRRPQDGRIAIKINNRNIT